RLPILRKDPSFTFAARLRMFLATHRRRPDPRTPSPNDTRGYVRTSTLEGTRRAMTRAQRASLSRKQKAVASAAGTIPLTIAGIALLRCGCPCAAFTIEI